MKLSNLNEQQSSDIKSCYDRTKDVESALRTERRKIIQLINLTEEYVTTLNEFSQITLIANSLVDKSIVTNSLENLQNEIQRHRKFFVNLNHCRVILESLERNLDTETRNKHSELHRSLHQKATVILEKAGDRAQKLSLAASKWTVLENRMRIEEQWLQVAEQRVPDLVNVTSADYEQYITLYQSLNADLTIHHSKILQDYETSKNLQELIYAPSLETRCTETLTRLLKIKDDVNDYLKRLLYFKNTWHEYNSNADKLEHWMNEVENELEKIDIPENFMTYPIENMRQFWEIKAQYEFNTQVHKKVFESFEKSLKIIGLADDKLQLQFYVQLDDRWQQISNRIDAIKNQIIENISSALPHHEDKLRYLEKELDEILFILNNTKGIIRNPEELNLYFERLIVLKSRIIVVENELVTIGFTSTTETERVGELCEKSHQIYLCVTEEMELADLCRGRLSNLRHEIEAIKGDQTEYYKNLVDFEGAAKLESAVIEKALESCIHMRDSMSSHWSDIMRVRHLLHTLPTGLRMSVSPVSVEKEISQLEDDYVSIEKRLCEVENLLKNRFSLWKRFEKQLEVIQQSIQETDFMVELLTIHGNIDYDRLSKATERLEGLHDDLGSHEDVVKNLKVYAHPILEFCADHVAQDIEITMQKANTKWKETNDNLKQICEKYKGAVNLWKKYCDESEEIRKVIDKNYTDIDEMIINKSQEEIELLASSLKSHGEKLNSLKKISSQIADSVGIDSSIQIDLDLFELSQQLDAIIEAVEYSKNKQEIGKIEDVCQVRLAKSQNLIENVKEDLKQEKETSDEDHLILLRSHLLNLGLIENDLQSSAMKSEENSTIVNTLHSLQQLFKETINKYNNLSSQLVHDADNDAIFKVWAEYLSYVQLFLQSTIPSDYSVLKEQLHLCKIHKSLVTNQRNALMYKISIDSSMLKNVDLLKNQHLEILNQLIERQTEIENRIDAWEKYRKNQFSLLEAIDDIEREKSLLQLKQIYLKSVPKVKSQIEKILSRISETENEMIKLKNDQAKLLNFIDDITSSALRLELSSVHQRLANIRASLETWTGYFIRIQELQDNYEQHVKSIQEDYQAQLSFLANVKNAAATNFANSKSQLESLKEKQHSLGSIKAEIQNLNSLKDEIKDYVSTYDVKMMRQNIWILCQKFSDINHEYSLLINQIEERVCLQTEFLIRYDNLMFWLNETEGRLIETSQNDESSAMRHQANNILEDFALKEYDRKWLLAVGNELLLFYTAEQNYDSPEKIDIECKIANLNAKWSNIKLLYDNRLRKITDIKATYYNLESKISEIRTWLFEIEKELLKPFLFEVPSKVTLEKQLSEYEKIRRSVENNSANVAEVLNLSEMVLSELRSLDMEMSINNLSLAVNNIEYRWKRLCESLVQRKRSLINLFNNLDEMTKITNSNSEWLTECDNLCSQVEKDSEGLLNKEKAEEYVIQLSEYFEKVSTENQTLNILEKLYNTVLTANVDMNNIKMITSETRRVLIIWKSITNRIILLKSVLDKYLTQIINFEKLYESLILKLTQIDVDITNIKHLKIYEGTDEELEQLERVKKSYVECELMIESAEKSKLSLMEKSSEEGRLKLRSMSDEYSDLFKNIQHNFNELNSQYEQSLVIDNAVQECDASVQVNTLQLHASVSPKDAYKYEIQTAINEFKINVDNLKKQVAETKVSDDSGVISKSKSQKIAKNIAACESSLELIKYLNSLLINDYECNNDEAHTTQIEELYDHFKLQLEIWNEKKDSKKQQFADHSSEADWKSCPFCSQRNWQQIDNDLWRLEQWLHVAENEQKTQQTPPNNIEELEDTIQDHREFLLNLDSHKSIISSLNIVGEHLALHTSDTAKAQKLRLRLADNNRKWDYICQHATLWQSKLQDSLIGNREFHKIINEFNVWLEDTERKIKHFEPVDLSSEKSVMESKFLRFKELKCEIERCEPRVISLQENSAQLLKSTNNDQVANETFTKLTDLSVKLQSLRRLTALYVIKLGAVLGYDEAFINAPLTSNQFDLIGSSSSSVRTLAQSENLQDVAEGEDDINYTVLTRSYRFLGRVIRASLPIQALMLVLLGACALIPIPNSDEGAGYSCLLTNTFGRTMEPILRYRNGNPPT